MTILTNDHAEALSILAKVAGLTNIVYSFRNSEIHRIDTKGHVDKDRVIPDVETFTIEAEVLLELGAE